MNLFDTLPGSFFNCLASGSTNRVYADCLLLIYHEYDREITYRIPRSQVRDALAVYLMEHQVEKLEDEPEENTNSNEMANAVIRRFCSREVGWLEEDIDDATYEKHIMMTEQGVVLAEFLQQLMKPEREEFSSYIFNVYNILKDPDQWENDPYINGLRAVYRNAKLLSKALKRLATFIKKIIERMVQEETMESLTENILEYCEGDFIKEYARLTKQQNIHIYRSYIRLRLEEIQNDAALLELLAKGCRLEENRSLEESKGVVQDMLHTIRQFFTEEYDEIMRDIKHKITVYLQLAIGRARFIRNRSRDIRGNVEQTIRILTEEMDDLGWKDELPEEMNPLFDLESNEFLDLESIRYPRKNQHIAKASQVEVEEMTEEDIERARLAHEREAENPYSKEKMKSYVEHVMGNRTEVSSDDLPLESKNELLSALSAVAYGRENGFEIRVEDGYMEMQQMLIRRFTIEKEEKNE